MNDQIDESTRIATRVAAAKMHVENLMWRNMPTKFEEIAALEKQTQEAYRELHQALAEQQEWIQRP